MKKGGDRQESCEMGDSEKVWNAVLNMNERLLQLWKYEYCTILYCYCTIIDLTIGMEM